MVVKERVTSLIKRLEAIPRVSHKQEHISVLTDISELLKEIVTHLCIEDSIKWDSLSNGFNYTFDYHIDGLQMKPNRDSYKTGREQILSDLKEILQRY